MRKAGILTSPDDAQKLTAAFYAHDIEAQVHEEAGTFTFWVVEDDQMDKARELVSLLAQDPGNSIFKAHVPAAAHKEKQDPLAARRAQNRARHIDVRNEVFGRANFARIHVTIFLIVASVLLTLAAGSPGAIKFTRSLYFSEFMGRSFPEILNGQIWRIFTPIFLHGGMLHLGFNMLWLYQLGGPIERNERPWYLVLVVFTLAAICNTAQYLVSGPNFIGMSGVVYGLLGYTWMMSTHQRRSQYFMHPSTVTFMMIWMVLCLVGIIPGVANTQHVTGMVVGTAWGYLRAKMSNR